jgi:intraflagellar transport protein 172
LNQSATKLLFRDKKRALHLYDIATQTRITLLPFCNYVQWVPESDVVVAQSRQQLCVWYSIDHPADITTIAINGDVEQIERAGGKTEVIVDEGLDRASYPLDESLIAFGSAVEAHDFPRAVTILEKLAPTASGYEAMWSQLSKLSLDVGDYIVAERCASALGDVSKRKFLGEINAIIEAQGGNKNHYLVKAKVAMLKKEFKRAEQLLLAQGGIEDAINMYRQAHRWSDALQVSEAKNHPGTGALRQEYFQYLLSTRQEELAGELKEKEGEYSSALQLYLRGGFPVKAAALIRNQGYTQDPALLEQVADALMRSKAFEKAGEFLESLKLNKRALEAYCRGNAWAKAVELCRHASPGQVVRLEEEWGDYLAGLKQWDAACNHYMQAGSGLKAVNAAVEAGQWTKAVGILDSLEPGAAKPYLRKIAQRYASTKNYHDAEKYFVQGGVPQEAVNMYMSAGLWEKAHAIAQSYMSETEVHTAYVKQAKLMESQGKFKEAERLYLQVEEADEVIAMYRKNRQFEAMMTVVVAHRPAAANEAWLELGHMFETEGNFKLAEQHYLRAKGWKPTLQMYKDNDLWEDALRIAKGHGGQDAYKETAYEFAKSVGGDAGGKLLAKRGLADLAVDYAVERREWPEAFALAEKYSTHKLLDVHYNHGMALEDDGRFEKAE